MELLAKIIEITGDETKAKEVVSSLGEYMIPKAQYNKKVQELEGLKSDLSGKSEELENIRLSSMSEQEKLKHEFEKATKIQNDYSFKTNRLEAEKMFVKAGLSEEQYNEIIDSLVHVDGEQTKKVVSGVIGVLVNQREVAVSKTKEQMINDTPTPTQGNSITQEVVESKRFL